MLEIGKNVGRVENKESLVFTFFVEHQIDADEVAEWIDQSYKIKDQDPPEKYESSELFDWALDYIIEETKTQDELHRIFVLTEEGIKSVLYPGDIDDKEL